MAKVAAIQMCSVSAVGTNLLTAQFLMSRAVEAGASVIVLPENFAFIGSNESDIVLVKEQYGSGRIQDFIAAQARELGVWIIAGTIPLASDDESKVYSSTLVYNDQGVVVACYNKIHLLNADLGGLEHYQETESILPGNGLVVVQTPVGRIGLSISYDLRFPKQFRELRDKGAEIIAVPSAYPAVMGKLHWKPLLKARAIENQCYVIGANQEGMHDNHRQTFGHTIIVGPWGRVLGFHETGIGYTVVDVDLERLHFLRAEFLID
ncbi:MAG: carbon-nitrogen hydrolase family protein [Gammaproteobacteria bacterium]|nr:carbon-nitrogen hydrolase family protein [Gammaproteobacteria bacterium]